MAMTVTITGLGPIRESLTHISGKIENPKPILEKISGRLLEFFDDTFETEGARLLKTQWKALSPTTLAAKAKLGFGNTKILERTGKLRKGIKQLSLTKNELVIGNKVKYYPYHQLGAKRLPQRQMIGLNKEVIEIVMEEVEKEIHF